MSQDPAELRAFAERYTAAWCSMDPAAVAAHYAPEGTLAINGGSPAVGRDAITVVAASFYEALPDMQVYFDDLVVDGDRIEYHWTFTGTNTGPGGTGNAVRVKGFERGRSTRTGSSPPHWAATTPRSTLASLRRACRGGSHLRTCPTRELVGAERPTRMLSVEVVRMLDQLPQHRSDVARPFGDRALRWSWYLFLLSYPWHLIGGAIAYATTRLAGGDFGAGEGVPGYVYPALYVWMMAPLVASIVVGLLGWLKGHRPAALLPALAGVAMVFIITIFSYEEFWS